MTSQLGFDQLRKIILINLSEINLQFFEGEVSEVPLPVHSLGEIALLLKLITNLVNEYVRLLFVGLGRTCELAAFLRAPAA